MTPAAPTPFSAFPDPWEDRGALAAAALDCRRAFESLLPRLSGRLDEIHGETLGPRYWRIVLGPWLLYHLQQLEDRRRRADAFLAAGAPGLAAADTAGFETPRDTPEFLSLFPTERYNLQLLALCLRRAGASPAVAAAVPRPSAAGPGVLRSLKAAAKRAVYGTARRLRRTDILTDGVYPLGRRHGELNRACGGGVWPLGDALPEHLRVAAGRGPARLSLQDLPGQGPLEALAVASLPSFLPALFLEGFPAARAYARRALGKTPKTLLHSSGVYYDELYKLCAAEASLEGARLVGVQHGGQYGVALWSNAEWFERSVTDEYLTWGWTEDAKTVPLPMPWLSDAPDRTPVREEVLLVSTSGHAIPHELFAAPMGTQYRAFFGWRDRFLDALGPGGRTGTRVRLFPVDCGWGERPALTGRFPGLRFDSGSFRASVSRSALVVTDHPGTVFLETLAWGIPGVHFWEDRVWASRPAAAAALEPLRRAGIVHGDPESAARQVAAVRADPASWWDAPATRAAREGFVRLYARADPDWAHRWAATLGETSLVR